MKRLRIELLGEGLDAQSADFAIAIFADVAGDEIFEIKLIHRGAPTRSGSKTEMKHVAVGDDIILAFETKFPGFAGARFAAAGDIIRIGDCLGANEAFLEIGVDDAGGLRRFSAFFDSPGARLFRSHREERHEVEKFVASPDHAIEARLVEADGFKIILLLVDRQYGDLTLDLRGNDDSDRPFFRRLLSNQRRIFIAVARARLLDIADVENRLRRQETKRLESAALLRRDARRARRPALPQFGEAAIGEIERLLRFLVGALGFFLQRDDSALEAFEIGEHQFSLDRRDVRKGIDAPFDMSNVAVFEATDDMGDGVAFADIGEELIAQPLALGRAPHEAGNVDEGQASGDDFFGAGDFSKRGETRVRHGDVADIRLDRAERVIRRLRRRGLGERVKKRRLADIRQSDDTAFETHESRAR